MNLSLITFVLAFGMSLTLGSSVTFPMELYWVVVTLITIPLWETRRPSITTTTVILWIIWLTISGVSAIFSWDQQRSVATLIRLILGFIWFRRYATLTRDDLAWFTRFLGVLSIGLFLTTITILVFPPARSILGPRNLIFSPAGHLPSAYIALPLLPILLSPLAWWLTLAGIVVSSSRAAWALLVVYLFFARKYAALAIAAAGVATIVLLRPSVLTPYLTNDPIPTDARIAFAKQALLGIKTSPLIGTGPGTFFLLSKRYAQHASQVSVSSHNILLDVLSEYGVLGTLAFVALIIFVVKNASTEGLRRPFLASVVLTLLLGLVEQSMDRAPVFLWFAISLGIISKTRPRTPRGNDRIVRMTSYAVLMILIIVWFVLAMTRTPQSPSRAAVIADPTNVSLEREYLMLLNTNPSALCDELRRYGDIPTFPCHQGRFGAILESESFSSALTALTPPEGKPKFFYMLGHAYLERKEYETTRLLWAKARDLAPNWGYYHVELASLLAHEFNNPEGALSVLRACPIGCTQYLNHIADLPTTGSLLPHIEAIPRMIDVP